MSSKKELFWEQIHVFLSSSSYTRYTRLLNTLPLLCCVKSYGMQQLEVFLSLDCPHLLLISLFSLDSLSLSLFFLLVVVACRPTTSYFISFHCRPACCIIRYKKFNSNFEVYWKWGFCWQMRQLGSKKIFSKPWKTLRFVAEIDFFFFNKKK